MLAGQLLPQFRCHSCTAQQKKQRGCTSKPQLPMVLDGEELERCPMRGFLEDPDGYNELFLRYRWMKEGYLADPGLLPDQAAPFVALSLVITQAVDDANAEQRKKRERDAALQKAAATKKQAPRAKPRPKRPWRGRGR